MNKTVFLITGPSGSGKTSLADYLTEHKYNAIDADSTPGLCFFVNKNNKPVPYPPQADASWWQTHNYIWELDRLHKFIDVFDAPSGEIFLCGTAGNMTKAWDMFEAVYYLDIPVDIIPERIASAPKNRSFGRTIHEPEQLAKWAEPLKKEMESLGAVMVDATRPLADVALDIIGRSKAKPSGDN